MVRKRVRHVRARKGEHVRVHRNRRNSPYADANTGAGDGPSADVLPMVLAVVGTVAVGIVFIWICVEYLLPILAIGVVVALLGWIVSKIAS